MKSESSNEYQVYSRRYSANIDYRTQVRNHISKLKKEEAKEIIDCDKKKNNEFSK